MLVNIAIASYHDKKFRKIEFSSPNDTERSLIKESVENLPRLWVLLQDSQRRTYTKLPILPPRWASKTKFRNENNVIIKN